MSTTHGYRVVAVDIAGRGQSERLKNRAHYEYKQYVSDMTSVIQHLQPAGRGTKQITWVGMSMGGLIGMMYVSLAGKASDIQQLVMVDVGPVLQKDALHHIAKYVQVRCSPASVKSLDDCSAVFKERYASSWGPFLTEAHVRYLTPHSFHVVDPVTGAMDWIFDPAIGAWCVAFAAFQYLFHC